MTSAADPGRAESLAWDRGLNRHWQRDERPLAVLLTAPPDEQIILKLPSTLWREDRKYDEQIAVTKNILTHTTSGMVLARCLLALALFDVDGDQIPAPRREALSDYFGEFLFFDFQPSLFWPHYPSRWQEGMRNVLRHAILTGYERSNLNHAVCLIPTFFSQEEAGEIYDLVSLVKAANYDTWHLQNSQYDSFWHHWGLTFWIGAVWQAADERRREEMVQALFLEPALDRRGIEERSKIAPSELRATVCQRENLIPLHEWLRENPARLQAYLRHENPDVQQVFLEQAFWPQPFLVDPRDPDIARLMIDGLRSDRRGYQARFAPILRKYPSTVLPIAGGVFLQSDDLLQKLYLVELLVTNRHQLPIKEVVEFLYSQMVGAASSDRSVRAFFAARGGAEAWAIAGLAQLGGPARDYLIARLETCSDPRQAALSVFVLDRLDGLRFVLWDDHLADLLSRALESRVGQDIGFRASELQGGDPRVIRRLEMVVTDMPEVPERLCLELLAAYHGRRLPQYLADRQHWKSVP